MRALGYARHDLALGDAVAAADFRIVGKRRSGLLRVRRAASRGEGLSVDQELAEVGHILLLLEQVEIPPAVGGVAIEQRADDSFVPDDHVPVDAAAGVASLALFSPGAAR